MAEGGCIGRFPFWRAVRGGGVVDGGGGMAVVVVVVVVEVRTALNLLLLLPIAGIGSFNMLPETAWVVAPNGGNAAGLFSLLCPPLEALAAAALSFFPFLDDAVLAVAEATGSSIPVRPVAALEPAANLRVRDPDVDM